MKRSHARANSARGRAEGGGERWSGAGSKAIKEQFAECTRAESCLSEARGQATAAREQHEGKPHGRSCGGCLSFLSREIS